MVNAERLKNGYVIGDNLVGEWEELKPVGASDGNICRVCGNLESEIEETCKAFPEGIPRKFWKGEVDHTVPVNGDNGITFEPKN